MSSIKFVTAEDLQSVLQKLKDWMPFKKTDKGVVFNNGEVDEDTVFAIGTEGGNAFEVKEDGSIYVKDSSDKDVKLQDIIGATSIDPPGKIENTKIDEIIQEFN